MSRRWPGEQTCRRHPERITPTSQEAAPCAQRMPSQSWAQPEDFAISRGRVLAGCSRAGRGQHVGEPVADVDALPEPIGQGCLGVDVVRCRRDRVDRWDATNGSPAATDCSPCRGNRSRSPRRPSVANATGAHTGLASIAGPVLILISGAHRVDTAMVAANLRVRRLRRAAAGHAAGAAVQCDRSDCLEVERDPQLGAHLSFSIRGGLPLLLSIGLCPGPGRRIGCSACSHASCRFCLD